MTWDQTSQQTRVLRNTRNPLFEETLYFPVKLVRATHPIPTPHPYPITLTR